jgi:uncharacterized protein
MPHTGYMAHAVVGLCTIEFQLPGVSSLKEKRSILKSMLQRLHNTFNVSAAEVDKNDELEAATIGVAVVTNNSAHANQVINNVITWIEKYYSDAVIMNEQIEIL